MLSYNSSAALCQPICREFSPLCISWPLSWAELDAPDCPHGADSLLTYVGIWQNSWSSELLELRHVCKPCFQFYSWTSYWSFSDLELTQNLEIRKALLRLGGEISVIITKKYLGKLQSPHSPMQCPSNWTLILLKDPERIEEGKQLQPRLEEFGISPSLPPSSQRLWASLQGMFRISMGLHSSVLIFTNKAEAPRNAR